MGVGFGMGMDRGIDFKETDKFVKPYPDLKVRSAQLVTGDVFLRFSLGNINFYPSIDFTLFKDWFNIRNKQGFLMREGAVVNLPYQEYSTDWKPEYYSEPYIYHDAKAYVSQFKYGAFLTWQFLDNIEIGVGLFHNKKTYEVLSFYVYDRYYWFNSINKEYDQYLWDETLIREDNPETTDYVRFSNVSFPIILQYSLNFNYMRNLYSCILYPDKDTYIRFRIALEFGR
ncbi:hypothetical protein MASR2M117_11280 [Paludibacter sp.]